MLPTHTISTSYDKKRPYFEIYIYHVTSLIKVSRIKKKCQKNHWMGKFIIV